MCLYLLLLALPGLLCIARPRVTASTSVRCWWSRGPPSSPRQSATSKLRQTNVKKWRRATRSVLSSSTVRRRRQARDGPTKEDGSSPQETCELKSSASRPGVQEKLGVMNKGLVFTLWDYTAQQADELSFSEGDAFTVLRRRDDTETEWWWARLNDHEGYIPRNLLGVRERTPSHGSLK